MRIGLQPLDPLLQDREIQFGSIEVRAFLQPCRRAALDWLQVKRESGAALNGSEAMSLHDAARMPWGSRQFVTATLARENRRIAPTHAVRRYLFTWPNGQITAIPTDRVGIANCWPRLKP